ncbi:IDEAL domain-containing protein [Rossellomorea aquimaris]|uniref:IDEAL domain-containing protein n=1 Tax=Rossellomorea aquimaris TaxID=189382 RepID=UPI001CD6DBA9|nr:IDEAL domain-containing protein [Rossellomorea aquimaris]MCA1060521.1 IDEAL domain-containing protein [Rossellomorea aquimaris]
MSNQPSILKTGDWIKGTLLTGELVIGYIENLDAKGNAVKAKIVTSDNKTIEGKTIPLLNRQIKKIPDTHIKNKEQIQFLIDLALETGDEEWFIELTTKLNSMRELAQGVS